MVFRIYILGTPNQITDGPSNLVAVTLRLENPANRVAQNHFSVMLSDVEPAFRCAMRIFKF